MIEGCYGTKEASNLTGISRPALRTYTSRYARYLSTDATPERGSQRRFTRDDLRLLVYVYQATAAGATHENVQQRLADGALEEFAWEPPEPPEPGPAEPAAEGSTALVTREQVQAMQALLLDAQRREQQALEREQAAQEKIAQLERELGMAEGELQAIKTLKRRPRWLVALIGE